MRGLSKTAGTKLLAAEKRRLILELRVAGLSEREIVADMRERGYERIGRAYVHQALHDALDRLAKDESLAAEQLRELDLIRVDECIRVLHPLAKAGNFKAMKEYRAFIDQRARLLGTYAAQKTEVEATVNHRIDASDREEIARLEEAFVTASRPADAQLSDAEVVEEEQPALEESVAKAFAAAAEIVGLE